MPSSASSVELGEFTAGGDEATRAGARRGSGLRQPCRARRAGRCSASWAELGELGGARRGARHLRIRLAAGVHQDQPVNALRVGGGKVERHRPAEARAEQRHLLLAELRARRAGERQRQWRERRTTSEAGGRKERGRKDGREIGRAGSAPMHMHMPSRQRSDGREIGPDASSRHTRDCGSAPMHMHMPSRQRSDGREIGPGASSRHTRDCGSAPRAWRPGPPRAPPGWACDR